MSTSHRPQLEARSGAKAAGYSSTSIEHARLQPGHKTLKYRQHIADEIPLSSNDKSNNTIVEESRKVESHNGSDNLGKEIAKVITDKELLLREFKHEKGNHIKKEKDFDSIQNNPQSNQIKKGWRSKTTFSRRKNGKNDEDKDGYVNNITKSTYHQDFMKKIVK
ncbi:similar to Saccharomyces cerevisiae YDR163W CWC15 Non-essential protein involved in pre-mRNA splicing, component of a complex containing Cef1p [Maudiozyma saulgeensis]|uniref:Pre-mRNA-splicing factor CWC15 n=1 Tax=Maudiozyma saulgeensis TaxID=1789683 RepID=A0A1X7R667_9SACH|nr:similar to Saccharomyces cerevisiae YDR163W CWC15 Non-essential protein involved in pre-mRNA splicing, component of a complex containing Cef1p [Kazachstania saulgeensis]